MPYGPGEYERSETVMDRGWKLSTIGLEEGTIQYEGHVTFGFPSDQDNFAYPQDTYGPTPTLGHTIHLAQGSARTPASRRRARSPPASTPRTEPIARGRASTSTPIPGAHLASHFEAGSGSHMGDWDRHVNPTPAPSSWNSEFTSTQWPSNTPTPTPSAYPNRFRFQQPHEHDFSFYNERPLPFVPIIEPEQPTYVRHVDAPDWFNTFASYQVDYNEYMLNQNNHRASRIEHGLHEFVHNQENRNEEFAQHLRDQDDRLAQLSLGQEQQRVATNELYTHQRHLNLMLTATYHNTGGTLPQNYDYARNPFMGPRPPPPGSGSQ